MDAEPQGKLVRGLGLWSAASVVAGSVIGSAVFLVASDITRLLPSPGLALAVWAAASIISLIGGFVFAELGAAFPGAGGQYIYLKEGVSPLVGYLYGWTMTTVIQPGSIAAVVVAFAKYSSAIVPMAPGMMKALASLAVVLLTGINLLGVRRGAGFQNLLTLVKVLALVAIAAAGFLAPAVPGAGLAAGALPGFDASAFGVALIAAFWAFDGWNNVTFMAQEIKDPKRNIPLALGIGLAAVTALYLAVNAAYYHLMPVAQVAGSEFPGAEAMRVAGGEWAARAVVVAVVLSTLGCTNALILCGARLTYAMAEDGELPRKLAYVHPRYNVPTWALVLQMALSVALVWSGRYDQLFTYVISAGFVFYGLCGVALITLRRSRPGLERPYVAPFYPVLPAAYVLFSAAFVVNATLEKPWESVFGLGLIALGVPVYYGLKRNGNAAATDEEGRSVRLASGPGTAWGDAPAGAEGG